MPSVNVNTAAIAVNAVSRDGQTEAIQLSVPSPYIIPLSSAAPPTPRK